MEIDIKVEELISILINIRKNGGKVLSQPLGFYRIFITAKDALSAGFMLHAWLDADQPKQSKGRDIHSHTFDMKSRVLVGELKNEIYKLEERPNGSGKIVNVYHDGIKATRVVTDKIIEPILEYDEVVHQDMVYEFKSKVFHCTVINKYPTITLMRKDNLISDHAVNVLSREFEYEEIGTYIQPTLEQDLLWDRIIGILENITIM